MPKFKPHKGLLKRVRVTKSGQVKIRKAYGRHLRSHKPGDLLRSYRKARYASLDELHRLQKVLRNYRLAIPRPTRKVKAEAAKAG